MKDKKIIFMGTSSFAVSVLKKLVEEYNVVLVVTQPDSYVGRKHILTESPIKKIANLYNLPVVDYENINNHIDILRSYNSDIIVTCSFGQILKNEVINLCPFKTINVHASLLPLLRGAAPIRRALMNGFQESGITIMRTDDGIDTGDIITSKSIIINDDDDASSLGEKLSILGADLLIETLPSVFLNNCTYTKQDNNIATYADIITKEDEHLDFNKTTTEVLNHLKGLIPDIGGYANLDSKRIKIFELEEGKNICGKNGEIIEIYFNGIGISTLDGEVIIKKIQLPGKKIMDVKDYLNGVDKEELLGKIFE